MPVEKPKKTIKTIDKLPKLPLTEPTMLCPACHGTTFWLRDKGYGKTEYICQMCHPSPYKEPTLYEVKEMK